MAPRKIAPRRQRGDESDEADHVEHLSDKSSDLSISDADVDSEVDDVVSEKACALPKKPTKKPKKAQNGTEWSDEPVQQIYDSEKSLPSRSPKYPARSNSSAKVSTNGHMKQDSTKPSINLDTNSPSTANVDTAYTNLSTGESPAKSQSKSSKKKNQVKKSSVKVAGQVKEQTSLFARRDEFDFPKSANGANGLAEVSFEDLPNRTGAFKESNWQRNKRDREEYRQKLDKDPSFVPYVGEFFMHDHRNLPEGLKPRQRGRGGRGDYDGVLRDPKQEPKGRNAETDEEPQWKHDAFERVQDTVQPASSFVRGQFKRRGGGRARRGRFDDGSQNSSSCSTSVLEQDHSIERKVTESANKKDQTGNQSVDIRVNLTNSPVKSVTATRSETIGASPKRSPLFNDRPVRVHIPGKNATFVWLGDKGKPFSRKGGNLPQHQKVASISPLSQQTKRPEVKKDADLILITQNREENILQPSHAKVVTPTTAIPTPSAPEFIPSATRFSMAKSQSQPSELSDLLQDQTKLPDSATAAPAIPLEQSPTPLTLHQPTPQRNIPIGPSFHSHATIANSAHTVQSATRPPIYAQSQGGTQLQHPELSSALHAAPFQPLAVPQAHADLISHVQSAHNSYQPIFYPSQGGYYQHYNQALATVPAPRYEQNGMVYFNAYDGLNPAQPHMGNATLGYYGYNPYAYQVPVTPDMYPVYY